MKTINIIEKYGVDDFSITTIEIDENLINENEGCSIRGTLEEVVEEVFI